MTLFPPSPVRTSRAAPAQLFIEFDGQQLVVTSDEPEALEYFKRNYARMLVKRAENPIGDLRVMRRGPGYTVFGSIEVEHPASIESLYPYLRREVLLAFIRARPDLLWLHAGAIERDGGAIIISGTSGRGKSTLVTELCGRGWKMLSDETAPTRMNSNEVIPFPQMARRRRFPGRVFNEDEFHSIELEEVVMDAGDIRREPVIVRAIVFPVFEPGADNMIERLSSGDAALEIIRNSANYSADKAEAIAHTAKMAREIPCYRLTYEAGDQAAAIIDKLA